MTRTRIIDRVLIGVALVILGVVAGTMIGGLIGSRYDVDDRSIPLSLGYGLIGCFLGGLVGLWLGLGAFRPHRVFDTGDDTRYDVRIDHDDRSKPRIVETTAIVLGIDPTRARKLVESGSPIRIRARRSEVNHLQRMFSDWGVGLVFDPPLTEAKVSHVKLRVWPAFKSGGHPIDEHHPHRTGKVPVSPPVPRSSPSGSPPPAGEM